MRKKLESLREAVIIAARNFTRQPGQTAQAVYAAVAALEAYEAEQITGDGARANRGSTDTAHLSAALASVVQGSTRQQIIAQLAACPDVAAPGYTDEQLERRIGGKHQTVSSARNWLVETGWVRDSGIRRFGSSKRLAIVWELTPSAHRQILEDSWNHLAV